MNGTNNALLCANPMDTAVTVVEVVAGSTSGATTQLSITRHLFAKLFEIREIWRFESPIDSKHENQGPNSIRFVEIRDLQTVRKFVRSGSSCSAAALYHNTARWKARLYTVWIIYIITLRSSYMITDTSSTIYLFPGKFPKPKLHGNLAQLPRNQ